MERHLDKTVEGARPGPVDRSEVYRRLDFPRGVDRPVRRPYTVINMVSTLDGKVVTGGPGTTHQIGSETDHALMARIELQADAVLLGAGLARADDPPYPRLPPEHQRQREAMGLRSTPLWAIVSTMGEFPVLPRLLREGGPHNTCLFTTTRLPPERRAALERTTRVAFCGNERVDVRQMDTVLRDQLGIRSVVCLGGPVLNASLIEAGAADELFLTLAPKLQGGRMGVTAVEGQGFPAERLPQLELLSLYSEGSELYLRYRLPAGAP
jgi:riboflavin-specific deaminase-like protein